MLPKETIIKTKFGQYQSSVKVVDDKIIYYRFMEQTSGRVPAKEYNDLVAFHQQIARADRAKVVLVKPTE